VAFARFAMTVWDASTMTTRSSHLDFHQQERDLHIVCALVKRVFVNVIEGSMDWKVFLAGLGTGHDLPLALYTTTRHRHFVLLTVTAMKRDLQTSQADSNPQYLLSRKRQCTSLPKIDRSLDPTIKPPDSSHDWPTRADYIDRWTNQVAQSTARSPKESDAIQVNENMSGRQPSRRKANVRSHSRSSSPTKRSTEYRQNTMAFAHVYIEHVFELPPHVHAHRCRIVGDPYGGASELEDIPDKYNAEVKAIAQEYLGRCRDLTKTCKGEAEWKSLLLAGPIHRLVTLLGSDMLMTSASDKPWLAALKPRQPSLQELFSLAAPRLMPSGGASGSFGASPNPAGTTSTPAAFNYNTPPPQAEPSESTVTTTTTVTSIDEDDTSNSLTTPKPDISVGLNRYSFEELHQRLLADLQHTGRLLSEPHAMQLGLHFPFLLVEAKGLTTSGNIIGAENQAAVGGACALRILDSLASLGSVVTEPPLIIFTISTEGPIHELSIHYYIEGSYHMTVHRTWRTTLERDNLEFIFAIARIIYWGANSFRDTIITKMNTNIESFYAM
jgi:hypothetical protein